jgi:hypothetical protein
MPQVVMEGIVGAGVTITPEVLERLRPSEISFNLAKHLLYSSFRDKDDFPRQHLFPQIQRLARRWIDEGFLVTKGIPVGAIFYQDQLARAAETVSFAKISVVTSLSIYRLKRRSSPHFISRQIAYSKPSCGCWRRSHGCERTWRLARATWR